MDLPTIASRRLAHETLESRLLLTAGVIEESGDFLAEITRLKELVFQRDSNEYVAPNSSEQAAFETLANLLLEGDLANATSQAAALDYQVVAFTDTTGETYHILREQLADDEPTRGWGTYIAKLDYAVEALIEVPHPLFDTNSWEVGARLFQQSQARGFLMAGAHRHANGTGTADVAHLEESIFQSVHQVWNGPSGQTPAWQVQGFNLANHPTFPTTTEVVSSNGDGTLSDALTQLDAAFADVGSVGFNYNALDSNSPENLIVNDGVDGQTFASLAGQTNVQGQYSRGMGGKFYHIELGQGLRFDATGRGLAVDALNEVLANEPRLYVVQSTLNHQAGEITLKLSGDIDPATVQTGDLSINGVSATGVSLLDAQTLQFDLPMLEVGSHTASLALGAIASTDQIGVNAFHLPFDVLNPGTKFYVVDTAGDSTYEYNAQGELVDDYSLHMGNTMPRGAASDPTGSTLWVLDNDDFVYVYDADGNSLGQWKALGLDRPEGIATDGQNVWIVDRGSDRTYFSRTALSSATALRAQTHRLRSTAPTTTRGGLPPTANTCGSLTTATILTACSAIRSVALILVGGILTMATYGREGYH